MYVADKQFAPSNCHMFLEYEKFVQMRINFVLEKNGTHKPNGLGGKSIVVVRL